MHYEKILQYSEALINEQVNTYVILEKIDDQEGLQRVQPPKISTEH